MYHPTSRALTVLEMLQSRPAITGPELADRLEMDVRTVRRYINTLQDAGIPIEGNTGRYGGYKLLPGYKMPPLILSEEEATAAVLGLLGNSWLGIDLGRSAVESALSKISRVLPKTARERLGRMRGTLFVSPENLEQAPEASLLLELGELIAEQRVLSLEYVSSTADATRRDVEPYGLVAWRGGWYMAAYCRLRKDFRSFRLDRIKTWYPGVERFEKDDSFDAKAFVCRQPQWKNTAYKVSVEFALPPEEMRRRVDESYGTLVASGTGSLYEYESDDMDYAARYLVSLNADFMVQGPAELKHSLAKLAARLSSAV